MRKTFYIILLIAICATLIVPASAKSSEVTFTGAVEWIGYANVRNTKNSIEVRVFSKKPFQNPIEFENDSQSNGWPEPLPGVYHEIELSIYINKKNNVVKMSFSWGEYNPSITEYVLDARGAATDISETSLDIVITEIKILERVKPNRFMIVHDSTGDMVQFSVLFI